MNSRRAPTDRLCDALVVGFATFTLACHLAVAVGANLLQLLFLVAIAGAVSAVVAWRGSRPESSPGSDEPVVTPTPIPGDALSRIWIRIAAAVLGMAAVMASYWHHDVVVFWWSVLVVLAVAAVVFVLMEEPLFEAPAEGRGLEWGLLGLAVFCVAIALVTNRPDADDSFYVNVAVAAMDAPARALLSGDTLHGIEGLPLHQPVYRLHSFELLAASIGFVTGIPAIAVFHFGFTALGAFFMPLTAARLLRLLLPRWWLYATAVLVLLIIAIGETHRWYANFALVRMWQGKSFYLFVFMPVVYASAIEFARRPDMRRFALLAAAQIAAVGCSSSGVWAAPAGSLMAMCCVLRPTREGLRTFAAGALASTYVLLAGWFLMQGDLEAHDPLLERARDRALTKAHYTGEELAEGLRMVFGEARLHFVAMAAVAMAWAMCGRGIARRFAIVLPLAVWIVLLDPYLARFVTGTLTGPSYWRVLWSLPVPLLMAIAMAWPLSLRGPLVLRATGCVIIAAAVTLFVPAYAAMSPQNRPREVPAYLSFGTPSLKVPTSEQRSVYEWARLINEAVPAGAHVVAPEYISLWVSTFHEPAIPLITRESYIRKFLDRLGREEVRPRRVMLRYVEGNAIQSDAREVFRAGLDRFDVRAVVLAASPHLEETRDSLADAGFRRSVEGVEHELWVRN